MGNRKREKWKVFLQRYMPGMRILKTALTVFLCLLYWHWVRMGSAIDAAIAAIVCLQQDVRSTANRAFARVFGTFLAGIYTLGFLWVFRVRFQVPADSILYYFLIALFMIPLMILVVRLRQRGAVVIAAIVFVLVSLGDKAALNPAEYVAHRVLNTLVGILLALAINWWPMLNRLEAWRIQKLGLEEISWPFFDPESGLTTCSASSEEKLAGIDSPTEESEIVRKNLSEEADEGENRL